MFDYVMFGSIIGVCALAILVLPWLANLSTPENLKRWYTRKFRAVLALFFLAAVVVGAIVALFLGK